MYVNMNEKIEYKEIEMICKSNPDKSDRVCRECSYPFFCPQTERLFCLQNSEIMIIKQ
jgi:hypothetical protein